MTPGPIEEEIRVGRQLLQAMGERRDEPEIISCPTCARVGIDLVRLAEKVEEILETIHVPLKIAVMGCEVNGPGEAKEADLGIAGAKGRAVLFRKGKIVRRCQESEILDAFREELGTLLREQ